MEPENVVGYAHVKDGVVVNVSLWDGVQPYDPGDGVEMVPLPYRDEVHPITGDKMRFWLAGIGWDYIGGQFVDNRPVEYPFG